MDGSEVRGYEGNHRLHHRWVVFTERQKKPLAPAGRREFLAPRNEGVSCDRYFPAETPTDVPQP